MEKVNHLSDANTTALITGLSGIAGSIINRKNSGGYVSGAENQVANLSQQTLQALGLAQQQGAFNSPPNSGGVGGGGGIKSNPTILFIVGGVVLLIVGFLIFKRK